MAASAGSFYSSYRLDFSLLDQDIAAAKQRLAALQQVAARPVALGGTGTAAGASAGASAQRDADAMLRLAQQRARLAQITQGNAAAEQVLTTALQSTTGASERASLSVQTQVARLQSGASAAQTFGNAFKSGLMGIVGPAAAAGIALGAVVGVAHSFVEAFNFKVQLDASTAAINDQLRGVRDVGRVWSEAGAFAKRYGLTQQETNDILRSSIDTMRASSSSVTELETALLRLQSRDVSKPISEAARAMRELQAGDVTSIKELFNVPAREANRMKQEIQGGADGVKVLTAFLDRAGNGMEVLERRTQGAVGAMNRLKQANEDMVLAQAQWTQGPGMALLEGRTSALRAATSLLALAQGDVAASSRVAASEAEHLIETNNLGAGSAGGWARFAALQSTAIRAQAAEAAAAAQANAQYVNAIDSEIQAAVQAGNAERAHAAAMAESANRSLIDAQNKQTQTAQTGLLEAQTQAAARAFLALHPNITASGAASLLAANQISPLLSQLIQATLRAREAAQALAAFNALQGVKATRAPAAGEAAGEVRSFTRSVNEDSLKRQTAAAHAAADAEVRYQQELGNEGPALTRLKSIRDDLVNSGQKGSAAYFDTLSKIHELEQKEARGGRTSAGAARLSDQQKLNNQLLADEEKYQNKMEDLDQEHYKKQLDIQRDFEKRSLEEQHRNEAAKRQSRADFYDNLTTATKDLGQKEAQALSAQYEEAYAEAQKIAQAGNQKLARDYLELRQRQIQQEIEYQKSLAEARKNKDDAEIARLQQIHQLRQDAAAEEEKQLRAGGDANVNQRDEAMTAEQQRYEDAQGKIITASDRSADAKEAAAIRAGKAVDAENTKLREQEQLYDRIGARAGGGASAPATPGTAPLPPPSAGASPAAPAASGGEQLWRVFDSAVVDAIGAQTATLGGKIDATNGLLGGLIGRVQAVESAVRGLQGRFAQ